MSGLVQINLQSGQSIGLVPAAQACAPAAASCAGAGMGIVMQAPPGVPGPQGPPGSSNLTGGAGILVVGSEIRLSIGTLPPSE